MPFEICTSRVIADNLMSDIGTIILFLALEISFLSAVLSFFGDRKGYPKLVSIARIGVFVVCGLLSLSVALLLYALFSHDFSLEYVADYSSRATSALYLLTSFWAGNEGSLLFWGWLISVFAVIAVLQNRAKNREIMPSASSVIMIAQTFFLVLLVFVARPFIEAQPLPIDGRGLNPQLENLGMLLHPPVILAGYVSLTVPFALAVAALVTRRLDDEWVSTIRRWVLISWLLLGAGNLIGAWWAYNELGWGGYWNWDPVENVGLMPWLTSTAVLHACVMQRRRGIFKAWNMILIIVTFNLTIFGTFITRSDFLTSVHNYGLSDLEPFFIGFLYISLLGPLALVIYRRDLLRGDGGEGAIISRENAFLLGNVILVFTTLIVFLGTLLHWTPSFFNYAVGSTMFALIVLMGVCALIGWRREKIVNLLVKLLPGMFVALIVGLVLALIALDEWYTILLFALCSFVGITIIVEWLRGVRARGRAKGGNPFRAFLSLFWANKPRYGGLIVHLGILIICVGVIGSSFYSVETSAELQPGESITIENYTLTYEGISMRQTENKQIFTGILLVYDGEKLIGDLLPQKQFHMGYLQWVSEVAIRYGIWEDLYVSLASWDHNEAATFKVLINPLVTWIWVGGGILLLGSLIALWPNKEKRELTEAESALN